MRKLIYLIITLACTSVNADEINLIPLRPLVPKTAVEVECKDGVCAVRVKKGNQPVVVEKYTVRGRLFKKFGSIRSCASCR